MNILEGLKESQEVKGDVPNMCKCSECGGTFKVTDCLQEYGHHDGWEMPAYNEIYCPICESGGCVDDVWFDERGAK